MGWKNVKDHYRIGHIVQVTDKGICIGSSLCHDLIVIDPYRGTIIQADVARNEDLTRYLAEMRADPDKLRERLDTDDHFDISVTVYTYKGGDIIERQCEKVGWPNVTHDGQVMYDNTFSTDRNQVLQWAINEAEAGVRMGLRRIEELDRDCAKAKKLLHEDSADLAKLRHEQLLTAMTANAE